MIARIFPIVLLLILLPDYYIYRHHIRRKKSWSRAARILWWVPAVVMVIYTIYMATTKHFIPENPMVMNVYLLLVGLLLAPKAVYAICSAIGLFVRKRLKSRNNYGNLIGLLLSVGIVFVVLYSFFIGPHRLNIRQEEFVSEALPASFNGYRIAQISDIHTGSIPQKLLERAVDSINARQPDLIVFTGDLQNMQPDEIRNVAPILSRLKAKDGVYSILGNHDYSFYLNCDEATARLCEAKMVRMQQDLGWHLLLDEHVVIHNGNDSIVLVGMENVSQKEEQSRGNIEKAMRGVGESAFVVMLQHDPTAWRSHILPRTEAHLTLSGHTHGGQFRMVGLSPFTFKDTEWSGYYENGARAINVSTGLGGLVPFRFGVTPEVVFITLKR